MFSSFLKSIAKGPRAVLAENIATVLSEHFVLDPVDIESSLLKDAKIVLKNTHIRERKYRSDVARNTVVSVKGVVEEVVFSWRWSLTGETSTSSTNGGYSYASAGGMVQDVVLTIRGLKVQIMLDAWDQMDEAEQILVESLESTSIDDGSEENETIDSTITEEKEGFMKQYIRQVVDHLVLKLEDFEFVVQVRNGPSVIVSGKNLELGTICSTKATDDDEGSTTNLSILRQRISIGSVLINGRDNESGRTFVFMEPFGYAAAVTRLAGERFRGGILSGLEIVGQLDVGNEVDGRVDEDVVLHIGLHQIQTLSAIGLMLVPSSSYGAESSGCNDSLDEVNEQKDAGEEVQYTTFNLPLPGLTIVLPPKEINEISSRISFPRASLLYTTDGKVFQMEGQEGIKDNGTPLVELTDGGKWSLDFIRKNFDLNRDGGGCKMTISDEALTRMCSSIALLSSVDDVADLKDALESTKKVSADHTQKISSESWSISTGCITLHLAGGDNKWMEARIAHFSAEVSSEMDKFTEIGVGKCSVRSSFNNAIAMTVPASVFSSGTFQIPNTVEATVGSIDDAYQMRDFVLSFLQPTTPASNGNRTLPCAVKLDRLKLIIGEFYVDMDTLLGVGNSISCKMLNFHEASGIAASLLGVKSNFDSDVHVEIRRISTFVIPGIVAFDSPVDNTVIRYSNKGMLVDMFPIHARMLPRNTSTIPVQKDLSDQRNEINIPFRIVMRVAYVNLKTLGSEDGECLEMAQIAMSVSQTVVPQRDLICDGEKKGAKISLQMGNIKHHLFKAQNIHSSFTVDFQDLETLHQLEATVRSPRITAGFSTIDWSSLFIETESNDNSQRKRLKLPFAKISGCSVKISYQDAIVGSEATVAVPEFVGNSGATSDDLSAHYTGAVSERIPGFFTNMDVLGNNVVDTTFSTVGRVALHASSATTAGVSSVVGTAVADGVRGAISAGKASRNAATDDKYEFGDISRGIVRGVGQATKRGAQSRGSDGSDYVAGDFTVGAARSLGEYGGRNSRKLAAAGASGMGSAIGLVVAGPIGFLAGGYLGAKAVGGEKREEQPMTEKHQNQEQSPDVRSFGQNIEQQQQQQQLQQQQLLQQHLQRTQNEQARARALPQRHRTQQHAAAQSNHPPEQQQGPKPYKFGDLTRGILAKGKQTDGRSEDSGYKFGDFTRGLFN